jgi:hypothetical protein
MTGDDTAVDDGALDSVFASDRDRGGKAAPPEPSPRSESVPESAEKPAGTEAESEGDDPSKRDPFQKYRDPETGRMVPLNELKSEREKRQEASRKFEEADKRAKDLEAKYSELERRLAAAQRPQFQQQPIQQQPQRQRPDPWQDPEGALAFEREQILSTAHSQVFETRLAVSEELMASKPDYATMKELFVETARNNPALTQQMIQHPLPAKFAYEMGKKLSAEREVGSDLEAFKAKIREEARQQVLEELKAGTTVNPQPQKFPGTLADATPSGGDQGPHLSREAVMSSVFDTNRRRK